MSSVDDLRNWGRLAGLGLVAVASFKFAAETLTGSGYGWMADAAWYASFPAAIAAGAGVGQEAFGYFSAGYAAKQLGIPTTGILSQSIRRARRLNLLWGAAYAVGFVNLAFVPGSAGLLAVPLVVPSLMAAYTGGGAIGANIANLFRRNGPGGPDL